MKICPCHIPLPSRQILACIIKAAGKREGFCAVSRRAGVVINALFTNIDRLLSLSLSILFVGLCV